MFFCEGYCCWGVNDFCWAPRNRGYPFLSKMFRENFRYSSSFFKDTFWSQKWRSPTNLKRLGSGNSNISMFIPMSGKWSNLMSIFQMGWLNHQLELRVETPPTKLKSRILWKTKKNQTKKTKDKKKSNWKFKKTKNHPKKSENHQKNQKNNQILGLADSPLGCSAGSVSGSCLGRSSKSTKRKKPRKKNKKIFKKKQNNQK